MSLECFFRPKGVAVVGASSAPEKFGHIILKNIIDSGFRGIIVPINPKTPEILGLKCAPSILDIKDPVDLAVIVVPAKLVKDVVTECGRKQILNIIIISGGFRETGPDGARLEMELLEIAKHWGIRTIGPNCQGVNSPNFDFCATWPLMTSKGRMAIISQSGTIAAAFSDWASRDNLGISASVSMGNKLDVDEADLIEYFSEDPMTHVISLYVEGVKDGQKFVKAIKKCEKPVVVLKSGRTDKGKRAAETHTSAISGNDLIFDGILKQYDVSRCDTFEEFYDCSKAFAYLDKPRGNKIVIVTTSGGASILTADSAEMLGLDILSITRDLTDSLRKIAPTNASFLNPIDLTGDGASAQILREVGSAVRDYCDTVVYVVGDPVEGFSEVITNKDLVIYLGGGEVERQEVQRIHGKNIPVFPSPERGIKAFSKLVTYCKKSERLSQESFYSGEGIKGKQDLLPMLSSFKTGNHRVLSEHASKRLLSAAGVPVVREVLVETLEEAKIAAADIRYPVALKGSGPNLTHKTELGLVKLDLRNEADLTTAFTELKSNREVSLDQFLVQEMVVGDRELIIGLLRDPLFGPCVMFGTGGIYTEMVKDVCFRMAPLDRETAFRMFEEIKARELLGSFRGQKEVDKEVLVNILLTMSRIGTEFREIKEIDINPLKITKMGEMRAVDSLIILEY